MSTSQATLYMAWGNTSDPEARDALGKALTASYVAGTTIPVTGSDLVAFYVDVVTKSTLTTVYAKIQTSIDGERWVNLPAFTSPTVIGASPNQEIESEPLPLIRKLIIPGATEDQRFTMTHEMRTNYVRVLLKGNAAVAGSRVLVKALI